MDPTFSMAKWNLKVSSNVCMDSWMDPSKVKFRLPGLEGLIPWTRRPHPLDSRASPTGLLASSTQPTATPSRPNASNATQLNSRCSMEELITESRILHTRYKKIGKNLHFLTNRNKGLLIVYFWWNACNWTVPILMIFMVLIFTSWPIPSSFSPASLASISPGQNKP